MWGWLWSYKKGMRFLECYRKWWEVMVLSMDWWSVVGGCYVRAMWFHLSVLSRLRRLRGFPRALFEEAVQWSSNVFLSIGNVQDVLAKLHVMIRPLKQETVDSRHVGWPRLWHNHRPSHSSAEYLNTHRNAGRFSSALLVVSVLNRAQSVTKTTFEVMDW